MVVPLAALAPVAASAVGGLFSAFGQAQANAEAKEASQRQMDFQKETLRSQYQWGMEDMRKAGLNPILAYKQGGAGSASGSDYTPGNVGAAAVTGASTATSSALAAKAQETQLANIAADTALKSSQDKTQSALQIQALAQADQARSNSALAITQAARERATIGILGEQLSTARAAAVRANADEQILKTEAGEFARQAGTILRELGLVQGGR